MDKVEQVKALFADAYLKHLVYFFSAEGDVFSSADYLLAQSRSDTLREVLLDVFCVDTSEIQRIKCVVSDAFHSVDGDYQGALKIVNSRLAE